MKKNKNGFFLAETIIMIALVTTVIAFLYPNISKLYENYNNRLNHYDQVQDIYVLRAIEDYLVNDSTGLQCMIERASFIGKEPEEFDADINIRRIYFPSAPYESSYLGYRGEANERDGDCDSLIKTLVDDNIIGNETGLYKLYITGYMKSPKSIFPEFNKYLSRLKKTTNSPTAYRLIGVFKGESAGSTDDDRYASIKILLEG